MNMINKFLYAYKKAKRDTPDNVCFFRIGDKYEAYYEDAKRIKIHLEVDIVSRYIYPGVMIDVSVIPVDELDNVVSKLHDVGIGTRVSEQRILNGKFDIACDDYYYEFPFD